MRNLTIIVFICFFDFLTLALANPFKVGLKHYKDNNCLDEKGFPTRDQEKFVVEECAPDTLYRWGMNEEMSKIVKGKDWKVILTEPIFTSFSPLSTYPYSHVPYRFKVKKGVKFKVLDFDFNAYDLCKYGIKSRMENTILMRISPPATGNYSKGWVFVEYDACTLDVFESISSNQKLGFDEMILERNYVDKLVKDKKIKGNIITYIHQEDGTPLPYMAEKTPEGIPILGMDEKLWNKKILNERLSQAKRNLKSKNRIRFWVNPEFKDLSKEEILRRHFLTEKPTYWNWKTK